MNALLELADRVEAATGPEQRALLVQAFEATKGPTRSVSSAGIIKWHGDWFAFKKMLDAGAFLDAAMLLAPEGMDWAVGHGVDPEDRQLVDYAWCGKGEGEYVFAATPALALTAACLRAIAAAQHNEGEE